MYFLLPFILTVTNIAIANIIVISGADLVKENKMFNHQTECRFYYLMMCRGIKDFTSIFYDIIELYTISLSSPRIKLLSLFYFN